MFELVRRAEAHDSRLAIVDADGAWAYGDLLTRSSSLAAALLDGRSDLAGERVILLAPSGFHHVVAQWAIWRAGGMAVPLSPAQAEAEWAYVLDDAQAAIAIADAALLDRFAPLAHARGVRIVGTGGTTGAGTLPRVEADRPAMMLYTSGTTSRPKGVVVTHANLQAQAECLVEAWGWGQDDRILHVLPLNHVHGVVNALTCALWCGAACELLPGFDARRTWERLASGDVTLFMAVPTIYRRLIDAWQSAGADERARWTSGCRALRLMVSGSAALPVNVLQEWRTITGHTLLERYGMTEIGMALSNPLRGERRPGFVGTPLPGVEVRLVDAGGAEVRPGEPGEIHVRGPGVFLSYWRRPEATAAAFCGDRWFRTGDVAIVDDGMYRILGRQSVDIIKTGGEKISALEIEDVLRDHPAIADCAVVGVPDAEWGEAVAVAVVLRGGATLTLADLRQWARARLGGSRLPRRLLAVEDLPRNAMGKVSKPLVIQLFEVA